MKKLMLSAATAALVAGAVLSPALAQPAGWGEGVSNGQVWVNREYYKQVTPYWGPYDKATRCYRALSGQPPALR